MNQDLEVKDQPAITLSGSKPHSVSKPASKPISARRQTPVSKRSFARMRRSRDSCIQMFSNNILRDSLTCLPQQDRPEKSLSQRRRDGHGHRFHFRIWSSLTRLPSLPIVDYFSTSSLLNPSDYTFLPNRQPLASRHSRRPSLPRLIN
jgi:hypothetical protein